MGKRHAALAIVLILLGTFAFSQQRPAPQRGIPQRVLQDAVLGFYVTEFQKQAEVSSEVFGKILPFLQQFVQDRFQISQRRTRALNQLR